MELDNYYYYNIKFQGYDDDILIRLEFIIDNN